MTRDEIRAGVLDTVSLCSTWEHEKFSDLAIVVSSVVAECIITTSKIPVTRIIPDVMGGLAFRYESELYSSKRGTINIDNDGDIVCWINDRSKDNSVVCWQVQVYDRQELIASIRRVSEYVFNADNNKDP